MRQIYRRSSEEPPRKVSKWTNKTRVMVLAARGLSFRWVKALVVMVVMVVTGVQRGHICPEYA